MFKVEEKEIKQRIDVHLGFYADLIRLAFETL